MNRRPTLLLPVALAVFAAGCAPNNAEMTQGSFTAFLASQTSTSIVKGAVEPEEFDEDWTLDCREFENKKEEAALQLEESILDKGACKDLVELGDSEFGGEETTQEAWLLEDGYYVVREPLDPWRGEALVTTEGDLQIGFHHALPGADDFRFLFVINPDFQPTQCVAAEDGVGTPENLDGDWVGEWSKTVQEVLEAHPDDPSYDLLREFPNGKVYFLTSFAYQFNPDDPQSQNNPFWSLPNEWGSGTANGKFSQEFFSHRTIRYGEPILYSNFEATEDSQAPVQSPENVWYCNTGADEEPIDETPTNEGGENAPPANDLDAPCQNINGNYEWQTLGEMIARAEAVADETSEELALVDVPFRPIVEDNLWRKSDGNAPGLDGWAELHYNWVVIDENQDISKGGSVSGAFHLLMDGTTSTSRYFISGRFDVERIRGDIWSNKDLQEQKAEEAAEAGSPLCE